MKKFGQIFFSLLIFSLFFNFFSQKSFAQTDPGTFTCAMRNGACMLIRDNCNDEFLPHSATCSESNETSCSGDTAIHTCVPIARPVEPTPAASPVDASSDPGTYSCGIVPVGTNLDKKCMFATNSCKPGFKADLSKCNQYDLNSCLKNAGPYNCEPDSQGSTQPDQGQNPSSNTNSKVKDPKCGDTVADLDANPNPQDYNRILRKPIDCDNEMVTNEITYAQADISQSLNWLDTFIGIITGRLDITRSVVTKKPEVFNQGADTTSPGEQQTNLSQNSKDWRTFLVGYDPELTEKKITCAANNNCASLNLYETSAVNDKLKPPTSMNANKEWKETDIADREIIMCHILSGYKRSIYNGATGDLSPTHDYTAGFLSSNGVFAKPSGDNRPLYGIEIICRNPDLVCPGISSGEKGNICTKVLGSDYPNGNIDGKNSFFGKKLTAAGKPLLQTPSLDCLYANNRIGCGALYYLPIVRIEESSSELSENVNNSSVDPTQGNQFQRYSQIAAPTNAVRDAAYKIYSYTASQNEQKRPKTYGGLLDKPAPADFALTGEYSSQWKPTLGDTIFAIIDYIFGRQVGQASGNPNTRTPDPLDLSSNTSTLSATETRKIDYKIKLAKSVEESNWYLTQLCLGFSPPDLAKKLTTPIDGYAPVVFPFKNEIGYGDNISGSTDVQFPLLGGAYLTMDPKKGICQHLLTGIYDPRRPQADSNDKLLNKIVKRQELDKLSQMPWGDLLSFQEQKSDESLSNK